MIIITDERLMMTREVVLKYVHVKNRLRKQNKKNVLSLKGWAVPDYNV